MLTTTGRLKRRIARSPAGRGAALCMSALLVSISGACRDDATVSALERRTRELRSEITALRADLAAARETDAALRRDVAALWSELAQLRPSGSRAVPRH